MPDSRFLAHATKAALIGAGIAAAIHVVYGLAFEVLVMPSLLQPGTPQLSYGQEAGFMAFCAAGLGGSVGFSVALCKHSHCMLGLGFALGSATVTVGFVAHLWSDSHSRYGPDPSDNIVFVPLFVGSVAVLVLTVLVAVSVSVFQLASRVLGSRRG
jgi:hypothetical protein